MWHDIFNAALGLGCHAIGGLTVRFLGTLDAMDKAQEAQRKELARLEADVSHLRGTLGLPPYSH